MPRKKKPTRQALIQRQYRKNAKQAGNPTDRDIFRALSVELAKAIEQGMKYGTPFEHLPPGLLEIVEGAEQYLSVKFANPSFDYRGRIIDCMNDLLEDRTRRVKVAFAG